VLVVLFRNADNHRFHSDSAEVLQITSGSVSTGFYIRFCKL